MSEFRALVASEISPGVYECKISNLPFPNDKEGHSIIRVSYSSLNYKDALSAKGNRGVTRSYPFVPGIDASGTILKSTDASLKNGDQVIVTGYDLGMNTFGGFGEIIQVPNEWIVKLPETLSLLEAMQLGTAGLTAAASVYELKDIRSHLPILVTGATGGVGSIALKLLQHLDFDVQVITGKPDSKLFTNLDQGSIINRSDFENSDLKPLVAPKFIGAVDTAGGQILNRIFPLVDRKGIITICGMVSGPEINTTVFPFILRGIRLIGIDSAESPRTYKEELWQLLSSDWKIDLRDQSKIVKLDAMPDEINKIHSGLQEGRVVLQHGE